MNIGHHGRSSKPESTRTLKKATKLKIKIDGLWTIPRINFTVLGQVYSLKNSRLLIRRNGRFSSIKHPHAAEFERQFMLQAPTEYSSLRLGSLKQPLRTIITVFYPSYRQDLDCGAIYDLLQKAGIVSNDRWIREKVEYAEVDPTNPRCEITVEVA